MIERKKFHRFAWVLCTSLVLLTMGRTPASADTWDWVTAPSRSDEKGGRDWGIEVVPYLWLASLAGDMGLPATGTIPVDSSFSDLAEHLDGAFAGFMDVRYRRWHMLVDGSFVRLKDSVSPDPSSLGPTADVESSVAFGLGGFSYELPLDWAASTELYLAARWWSVDTGATITTGLPSPFPPTLSGDTTETWADAVVGTRIRYPITEKWRATFAADVGAGASDIDWQVLASVGYMFNPHIGLTAAYRIMGVDYSSGGFVYDVRQSGLLLGLNLAY